MANGPRILIIDDEESLLEFLSLLFEEEGYRVATAASMADAREITRPSSPRRARWTSMMRRARSDGVVHSPAAASSG